MRNSLISLFIFLLFSCSSGYKFKTEDENIIKLDYDFYLLEDGLIQFDVDLVHCFVFGEFKCASGSNISDTNILPRTR